MFQLTNYDPGLASEDLCPTKAGLPADGVVLYVQHDLASIAEHYAEWPVEVDPNAVTQMGWGEQTTAAWRVGEARFQASLAFGPEASEQDRDTLLRVFRSLQVVDPRATKYWHGLSPRFMNTWYVVWGVRQDEPRPRLHVPRGRRSDTWGRAPACESLGNQRLIVRIRLGPFDVDETFQSRLVARDESGRILHEEPLEREGGTP
jgi:hypothetical protein